MTTIAYKDGVLAADRLTTEGHERFATGRKIGVTKDPLGKPCGYAAYGNTALCQRFAAWAKMGFAEGASPPSMKEGACEASGAIIYRDGTFVTYDPLLPPYVLTMHREPDGTTYCAFGSGGEYALGAMAAGVTATTSVMLAAAFDIHTGHELDFVNVPEK